MQALRMIKETTADGELLLKFPKAFGRKVEIIVLPLDEAAGNMEGEEDQIAEGLDEEALFLAAAFGAVTEDDAEEDAVWRKYLQ